MTSDLHDPRPAIGCLGVSDDHVPVTESKPASALAVGAEVVLKLSGTPIFDHGRQVSSQDNLTFFVEVVDKDRILVVSRDKSVRGWVFSDQIVPLERADEHFNRVVANDPRDAEAFWIHARLQYYRDDLERALANVNRAIRLEPDQARFYLTRAVVQVGRQQADRAIEDCNQAIELDPRSREPTRSAHMRGYPRTMRSERLPISNAPCDSTPTNPSIHVQQENPANAPMIVKVSGRDDKTVKPDPRTAAELIKQGEDRLASNEYDQALADFNEAIRLDPDLRPPSRLGPRSGRRSTIATGRSPITPKQSSSPPVTPRTAWRAPSLGRHRECTSKRCPILRTPCEWSRTTPHSGSRAVTSGGAI